MDFPTRLAASNAFDQIKKTRMRVEYAKPDPRQQQQQAPQQPSSSRPQPEPQPQPQLQLQLQPPQKFTLTRPLAAPSEKEAIPIAPHLGISYPSDPQLRYRYPDPSPEILANITHAIASVPRLYVQVLHLMNKMNLPPPFVPVQSASIPEAVRRQRAILALRLLTLTTHPFFHRLDATQEAETRRLISQRRV